MWAPNHNRQMRSENGGGSGRSGSGSKNLGQKQNMDDEINPDVDPRLRVMEQLREFFSDQNRDGIMCSKRAYGR